MEAPDRREMTQSNPSLLALQAWGLEDTVTVVAPTDHDTEFAGNAAQT